jgi:hypothetical protein
MKRTKPGMSPFWDCIGMRETVMKEGYAEIEMTSHQIFINAGGLYTAAFLPRSLMQPLVWLFVLTL